MTSGGKSTLGMPSESANQSYQGWIDMSCPVDHRKGRAVRSKVVKYLVRAHLVLEVGSVGCIQILHELAPTLLQLGSQLDLDQGTLCAMTVS